MSGGFPSLFGGTALPEVKTVPITRNDSVPSEFADALYRAAQYTKPSEIAAEDWAAVIGGMVSRESAYKSTPKAWGSALRPRGPGGLGDPTPRFAARPPDWSKPTGISRTNNGAVEYQYGPPSLDYVDGEGFGFGLCQMDYQFSGESEEWFASLEWADPYSAFVWMGRKLAGDYRALDNNLFAAVAAYNAGRSRVSKFISQGRSPDAATTGKDYAADSLARAVTYGLSVTIFTVG